MQAFVTVGAQGNQVQVVIMALLAAKLFVMNLKVLHGTTDLASPTIAAENLFSESIV